MAEQLTGIRKYLNDQGYADNDIGYNNDSVTLKGKNFYNATPQAQDDPSRGLYKDSTYGTPTALQSALKTWQGNDNSAKLNTTTNNMYNTANSTTPFQFNQVKPFEYNQQSIQSDPIYQSAIAQALQGAQQATGNAMVGLGARGIGNSSVAVDRANQIQQRSVGEVNSNLLPQLIQQAFQRYQTQNDNDFRTQSANYGVQQDQFNNQSALANYLNGVGQQEFQNERALNAEALQNKGANWSAYMDSVNATGNMGTGPKADWSLLGGTNGSPTLQGQQFEYGKSQDALQNTAQYAGIYNGMPTMQKIMQDASIDRMTKDDARAAAAEARSKGNQELGALFDIWDRTGVAPSGITGVPEGTRLAGKTAEIPTFESQLPNFKSIAKYDSYGDLTNPEALESSIILSDLSDYEKFRAYKSFGLEWPENEIPTKPSGNQ